MPVIGHVRMLQRLTSHSHLEVSCWEFVVLTFVSPARGVESGTKETSINELRNEYLSRSDGRDNSVTVSWKLVLQMQTWLMATTTGVCFLVRKTLPFLGMMNIFTVVFCTLVFAYATQPEAHCFWLFPGEEKVTFFWRSMSHLQGLSNLLLD